MDNRNHSCPPIMVSEVNPGGTRSLVPHCIKHTDCVVRLVNVLCEGGRVMKRKDRDKIRKLAYPGLQLD